MKLYFLRHAESLKSAEDRHGGPGLPLTPQGRADVLDLILFLEKTEKLVFKNTLFYCSDLVQVLETAKIIEEHKNISFQISSAIKNISLGVLDGLSKKEAERKYPVVADNLEKWRNGKIKIDDFTIPNAETLQEFYNRIFSFIQSITHQHKDVIIIGTRSVGVAITNIFRNNTPEIETEDYKRFLFDPSSVSKYTFENNKTQIVYINKTDFLKVKPKYPDQ